MSNSSQSNGKKLGGCANTNSSTTVTPASTPNTAPNITSVQSISPPNNAPKYGTLVPNRIFVGGISANTTESELLQLFSNYGTVKAAKIIQDRAGVSKGYGFITFESEEEAKRLQRESDNIVLRERKLNIAPAIKKQPFSRAFEASSPPTVAPGGATQYYIPAGGVPFYQGGVTYYPQPPPPPGDPTANQPPVYPSPTVYPAHSGPPQTPSYPSIVYPQPPMYVPQQFPYQPVPYDYGFFGNGSPSYMVGGGGQGPPQSTGGPPVPPGSPPRSACFAGHPLPFPNADAMFYNLPIYQPMDGAVLYPDTMDGMVNGNVPEGPITYATDGAQGVERPSQPPSTVSSASSSAATPDTTRQSSTPVVSLLNLDHRQEKDFTAMQSGRRRRSVEPLPPSLPPPPPPVRNGYVTQPPPPPSSNSFNGHFSYAYYRPPPLQNRRPAPKNSFQNPHMRPHPNLVGADENRNEDKAMRSGIGSPYQPVNQYGAPMINRYNSRSFNNSNHRGSYSYNGPAPYSGNNNNTTYKAIQSRKGQIPFKNNNEPITKLNNSKEDGVVSNKSDNAVVAPVAFSDDESSHSSASINDAPTSHDVAPPPQIPSPSYNGNQSFAPPARRPKRSVRRSPHLNNEMGAGDAPLQSNDVGDACRKLDDLKL